MTTIHKVGDVWKKEGSSKWLTKMPNGIIASKTKKRAKLFSDSLNPDFKL